VDPKTQNPVCIDLWESVGPNAGFYAKKANGFCDPNTIMLDKMKCHQVLPLWAIGPFDDGRGEDRVIFNTLQKGYTSKATGLATSYYVYNEQDDLHPQRLQWFSSMPSS
jgi:hypothetical protein